MKRILATVFMAVIAAAAFATVDLQTTSPAVYKGECSRIGSMKFLIANTSDYQNIPSGYGVLLKVYLKGSSSLAPAHLANVTPDAAYPNGIGWHEVTVDTDFPLPKTAIMQYRPWVYYDCGYDHFYVWIPNGAVYTNGVVPDANDEAWFTIDAFGTGDLYPNPIYVTSDLLTTNENIVTAVQDFTVEGDAVVGDPLLENPYDTNAVQTWEQRATNPADTTVNFLGTSYQPSDPSVAIVRTDELPTFEVSLWCDEDKNGNYIDLSPEIYLCKTFYPDQEQGYICEDGYRYGTICDVVISGDNWKDNSFIRLTPSDSDNVWLADSYPTVTATGGIAVDMADACWEDEFLDVGNWGTNLSSAQEVVCDYSGNTDVDMVAATDTFGGHSFARTLVIPVVSGATSGTITVMGLEIARYTDDGPMSTVGVDVNYSMEPCDYDCDGFFAVYPFLCCECIANFGTETIADVADFIDCDELLTSLEPQTIVLYYTYLPAVNGKWWAGAALINTTPLHMWTMYPVTQQDVHATLYFFEADGDLYMHDAGYIVAGGIWAASFTEGMAGVTPVDVNAGETTFGDERFWIVAVVEGTVPGTYITADGFGMLGDDVQAQGYLARLHVYGLLNMMTGMPDLSGTFNK